MALFDLNVSLGSIIMSEVIFDIKDFISTRRKLQTHYLNNFKIYKAASRPTVYHEFSLV
jgi:hypothetical protein